MAARALDPKPFPPHRCYVEPYGGAFSVGIRKPRSYAEVWNDLDSELVNLMRVLRDEKRAARLIRKVVIECRPALEVMATHDSPTTLHYVDPPYLPITRARAHRRPDNGGCYRHELSAGNHSELLAFLGGLKGMVLLSGYPSEIYD